MGNSNILRSRFELRVRTETMTANVKQSAFDEKMEALDNEMKAVEQRMDFSTSLELRKAIPEGYFYLECWQIRVNKPK